MTPGRIAFFASCLAVALSLAAFFDDAAEQETTFADQCHRIGGVAVQGITQLGVCIKREATH